MITNTGPLSAQRLVPVEQVAQKAAALRRETAPPPQVDATGATATDPSGQPAAHSVTVDVPELTRGRLQLSIDGQSGRVIGQIVDRDTGELIWQLPSEDMLRLIAATNEMLGPLFSTEA